MLIIMSEGITKEKKVTKETVEENKKKGLNNWQIAAIIFAILLLIVVVALVVYAIIKTGHNSNKGQTEARKREMKNGVDIKEKKSVDTGIKVVPNGKIIDKDGKVVPAGVKIDNKTDIELTKDAELAILVENGGSGNLPTEVNGIPVKDLNVDNNTVTYTDYNNVVHTVPMEGAEIKFGDNVLNSDVVNLMNHTSCKNGNVIIDQAISNVRIDGNQARISTNINGTQFGTTTIDNPWEQKGIYYGDNGSVTERTQWLLDTADVFWDNKYPKTKNKTIQDFTGSHAYNHCINDVSTNLVNTTTNVELY